MENPKCQPLLPFRPVPIYVQHCHLGTHGNISMELTTHNAKRHIQQLLFSKHVDLMHPVRGLGPLAEYRIHQLGQFESIDSFQLQHGINKLSVHDIALLDEIQCRHPQPKAQSLQSFQPSMTCDIDIDKGYKELKIVSMNIPLNNDRRDVDDLTVPVFVSCRNLFGRQQHGYGRKVFACPQCRYTTDRRNNLKRHMLTMHQSCTKTLECCGIVFATKASLREHAMIFHYHGYSCLYCGRKFCRKALLKRHLSIHSGQKDYVCPECDYATSHKSNLERHRKVHCRKDDVNQGEIERGIDESLSGGSDCHVTDENNINGHDVSSSFYDENAEINVDSD